MRLIDADKVLEGIAAFKESPWFNCKYGYADRKEAIEIIEFLIKNEPTCNAVIRIDADKKELIEEVIEKIGIVRCKDCKWWEGCRMLDDDNGYCSDGERKENVD